MCTTLPSHLLFDVRSHLLCCLYSSVADLDPASESKVGCEFASQKTDLDPDLSQNLGAGDKLCTGSVEVENRAIEGGRNGGVNSQNRAIEGVYSGGRSLASL